MSHYQLSVHEYRRLLLSVVTALRKSHRHSSAPPARQRQNREHAAWSGAAAGPRAWVPITTAGDRPGMLRTGQGARNADYFALSVPRFAARAWLQINLLCVLGEVISEREADLVHGV